MPALVEVTPIAPLQADSFRVSTSRLVIYKCIAGHSVMNTL